MAPILSGNTQIPLNDHEDLNRPVNLILAAIAPEDFACIEHLLTSVPLRMRETLQEAGGPPEFVYFPTSGIISVLTVMENGMMIEFSTVGREGTTGVPAFLEMGDTNMALVSQVPGEALRMATADFQFEVARTPSFAAAMVRYSGVMLALAAQSAACNRAHHVNERCARWLLMTNDQSARREFPITQEFLAQMLGVSRPSVTTAVAALQKQGLVNHHRGSMTIIDRPGLERASCECYAVIHKRLLSTQMVVEE